MNVHPGLCTHIDVLTGAHLCLKSSALLPSISQSITPPQMDAEAKAVTVVMLSACAAVLTAATMDKRSCRKPLHTTFEDALHAPRTNWFNKKLRCDRESFLRMYRKVHAAYKPKPAPNSMCPLVKRFALTMLYLAQGGTMDEAATVLGISRPRAVVYINDSVTPGNGSSRRAASRGSRVDSDQISGWSSGRERCCNREVSQCLFLLLFPQQHMGVGAEVTNLGGDFAAVLLPHPYPAKSDCVKT
ncbi:hypothetical protein GQ600_18714 [Phytophthora cactorum]|nr:hypothetical protein GQ600_18714 [Phytophthora cactorum]